MPDHFFVLYIQNGDFLVGERKRRPREIICRPDRFSASLKDKDVTCLVFGTERKTKDEQTNKRLQKKRLEGVEQ